MSTVLRPLNYLPADHNRDRLRGAVGGQLVRPRPLRLRLPQLEAPHDRHHDPNHRPQFPGVPPPGEPQVAAGQRQARPGREDRPRSYEGTKGVTTVLI